MKNGGRVAVVLMVAALLAVGGLVARYMAMDPLSAEAQKVQVPTGSDTVVSIQFAGDTMLGDAADRALARRGFDWPLELLAPSLDGDYVIANSETPITTLPPTGDSSKAYLYGSDPEMASALADAGIDALGLGNNHVMDRGVAGLAETISNASSFGMETFGAGVNLSAATRPLLLETPRGVVAVVSIGEDFGSSSRATLETPGMVVMSREMLEAQYNVARSAGADWVVAYVHWGTNYGDVDESQMYWAGQFADAGYDLVVGTGSHTAQPIAFIGSMPVLYGIGNLAFTSNGRYADFGLPGHGLLATLELPAEGEPRLVLTCLDIDNAMVHFQARPCAAADARQTLTALNPLVQVQGGHGYLPVDRFASHG